MAVEARLDPEFVRLDDVIPRLTPDGSVRLSAVLYGIETHETVMDLAAFTRMVDRCIEVLAEAGQLAGSR